MNLSRRQFIAASTSSVLLPSWSFAAPSNQEWSQVVDKAIAFLKITQNADGSWGQAPRNRGVTGVIVTGMLQCGKVGADDEPVAKALKFIESLVNAKAGHIAGP